MTDKATFAGGELGWSLYDYIIVTLLSVANKENDLGLERWSAIRPYYFIIILYVFSQRQHI